MLALPKEQVGCQSRSGLTDFSSLDIRLSTGSGSFPGILTDLSAPCPSTVRHERPDLLGHGEGDDLQLHAERGAKFNGALLGWDYEQGDDDAGHVLPRRGLQPGARVGHELR